MDLEIYLCIYFFIATEITTTLIADDNFISLFFATKITTTMVADDNFISLFFTTKITTTVARTHFFSKNALRGVSGGTTLPSPQSY